MNNLAIIFLSAGVFLALITWLTIDTDHVEKWTGVAFSVAIAGGLFIYGTINAVKFRHTPLIAVLRTVVNVGQMFGNAGDNGHDKFMEIVGYGTFTSLFYWFVHFFAYYSVVSAVVMLIGKDAVRSLRTWLLRIHDIELIFGVDENTVKLGEFLSKRKHVSLVFVGEGVASENSMHKIGALWYADEDAVSPNREFLKRLSIKKGRGKIRISALSADEEANYSYSVKMLRCLKEIGVRSSQTELVMFGREAMIGTEMQALGEHYGYGTVRVFDRAELSARIMLCKYPISDTISFDKDARATRDVNILMIGFGRIGQELLRKLIAGGQFEGSRFHISVFDPEYSRRDGFFRAKYPELLEEYDVCFEPYDGRSTRVADYVRHNADHLTGLIVAVGNENVGHEISYGFLDILSSCNRDIPVYQCYKNSVVRNKLHEESISTSVYDPEILYGGSLDALAVEINHFYHGDDKCAKEQWQRCDYFSRMSCRASADYLSGLLKSAEISEPEELVGERLENLAKSEHHRWCAFHYSMGYSCMNEKTLHIREEQYHRDNSIRITKDASNRLHACLIPWDDLDALSDYENAITGNHLDYKQMDRDNVIAVCRLLNRPGERDKGNSAVKTLIKNIRKRRFLIPVGIIALILLIGMIMLLCGLYKNGGKTYNRVSGYVPSPYADDVTPVSDSISFQEARYGIGDGLSKFVPMEDYTPPEYFPLRHDDKGLLDYLKANYPPTRDQGEYGTCWAHAATALAELSMLNQGLVATTVDYSELHLAYSTYHNGTLPAMGDTGDRMGYMGPDDPFLNAGGDIRFAALSLMKRRGVADENLIPYESARGILTSGISPENEFADEAHLRNAMFINIRENSNQVKQAIIENGAVGICYHADSNGWYFNEKTDCQYTFDLSEEDSDHAVIVVGWDDGYPKESFFHAPLKDGAWLVRNSWSNNTDLSEGSYFWLSYDDPTIAPTAAVFEMTPAENDYDNQYSYDSQVVCPNVRNGFLKSGANIFRVNGLGKTVKETLGAVTVYVGKMPEKGADYTVRVYRKLTDHKSPDHGELVADSITKGKFYYDGYYTVELKKPVDLERGELFSVVISLDGGNIALEQDCDYNGYQMKADCHAGESFYLDDKGKWKDAYNTINKANSKFHNIMIGALTRDY